MHSPSAKRFSANPIRGRRPVLQNCTIAELAIDPVYQRSTDNPASQGLIRAIARDWDWALCQPLVVAQRDGAGLFVVDGQHRLAAARLRGDIYDLPCVITSHAGPKEEAAAFVALNQQRKPLRALDLFKASLAGGDRESEAVMRLIEDAGLRLAPHDNFRWWQPGQVSNINGILKCQRSEGDALTGRALKILAGAFDGQVLRYGGTIFAGLWLMLADLQREGIADDSLLTLVLGAQEQGEWVKQFAIVEVDQSIHRRNAAAQVLRGAFDEAAGETAEEEAA